jgi:hypothetical protein
MNIQETSMILIVHLQNDSTARFGQARRGLVHLAALWHSLATTSLVQTSLQQHDAMVSVSTAHAGLLLRAR